MTDETFGDYMGEQISRIKEYKEKLEEQKGRSLTLEEAARAWVREYAEEFRKKFQEERSGSSSATE